MSDVVVNTVILLLFLRQQRNSLLFGVQNPKVHYRAHKTLPLDRVRRHLNPINIFVSASTISVSGFMYHIYVCVFYKLSRPCGFLSTEMSRLGRTCLFTFSTVHSTRPFHSGK
jgi:hypothetical protein